MEPTQIKSGGQMETKKSHQVALIIILVIAVLAIGGGFALIKKPAPKTPPAPQGTPEEKAIIEKLQMAPTREATPEEKATILEKLSAPAPKTPTDAERQKILDALTK